MTKETYSPVSVRVVVIGNQKGGSGKSTIAMNVAVGLKQAGHSVATLDLDTQQRSLTRYLANRQAWAREIGRELPAPNHTSFDDANELREADEVVGREAFAAAIEKLAEEHAFIVVDTPGQINYLTRMAHSLAETLITPLNDSFVDLDVLGSVDPKSFEVTGIGPYAEAVKEGRRTRIAGDLDWIVLRSRLSTTKTRNKQLVGEALSALSRKLDFRVAEGLAERTIFRELYPRGLTPIDELDKDTLGVRPTMSHLTAALEIQSLLRAVLRQSRGQALVDMPEANAA